VGKTMATVYSASGTGIFNKITIGDIIVNSSNFDDYTPTFENISYPISITINTSSSSIGSDNSG